MDKVSLDATHLLLSGKSVKLLSKQYHHYNIMSGHLEACLSCYCSPLLPLAIKFKLLAIDHGVLGP